jgi:chemotaxis signal transduction protein
MSSSLPSSLGLENSSSQHRNQAVDSESYAIVRIEGFAFAIPLTSVREVLSPHPVTHMPLLTKGWLGLSNVRGRIVSVFSLRPWLQPTNSVAIHESDLPKGIWLLLATPSVGEIALVADQFDCTQHIPKEEVVIPSHESRTLARLHQAKEFVDKVWSLSIHDHPEEEIFGLSLTMLIDKMRLAATTSPTAPAAR